MHIRCIYGTFGRNFTIHTAKRRKGTAQRPLQHSPRSLRYSPHHLLGVGSTIYNTHTLKPFKDLGLDFQRVKKLASKLLVHSVNFAAKLVHTRHALSSTIINSHQELVSGQACNPRSWSPLNFPFLFAVEELYGTQYQSGSFSLINVESGYHCVVFLFLFSFSGESKKSINHTSKSEISKLLLITMETSRYCCWKTLS